MHLFQRVLTLLVIKVIQIECRNQGCSILILVDDTAMNLINDDEDILRSKIDTYLARLNNIYQDSILQNPPNNNIFFFVKHVIVMNEFLPNCNNGGVSTITNKILNRNF